MDLEGKTIVITGANSGVGFAAARRLAATGAHIIMICRDKVRGENARKNIAIKATGEAPELYIADLSSQQEIYKISAELHKNLFQIDVLLNNAGTIFGKRELTVDGIEKTFAINYLAPFLLTDLLLDLVKASPRGRILNVASESHNGKIDFGNLQGEKKYNFFDAYNRSKLGNILFTYELARRLKETNIAVNCLTPGPTITAFGDHMKGLPGLFPRMMKRIPFLFGSPEKAAQTYVYVASSPKLNGISGKFFQNCKEVKTKFISYDTNVAAKLWDISQQLIQPARTYSNS